MGEVEKRSHLARGLDRSLHSGKEVLEAAEAALGGWVQAEAFDVGDLVDQVVVEEVQDLELLVRLGLPLFLRKGCLGHVRWKEGLGKVQHVVGVHQCLLDVDCLPWPRVRDADGRLLRHIYQKSQKDDRVADRSGVAYFCFNCKCVCSIA